MVPDPEQAVVGCPPPRCCGRGEATVRRPRMGAPRLQDLERDRCRVVTVGHQLVVCGGPAFLHHKVLSAIRTARGLEGAGACQSCPCFGWLLRTTIGKRLPVWMARTAPTIGI